MSATRPQARLGPAVLFAALALVLLSLVRVVEVKDGAKRHLLLLTPWDRGVVEFTNSVTGRPVRMEFRLGRAFQDFVAYTDPETEAYYTEGTYAWNQRLRREARRRLSYCSEVGLFLQLGTRWFGAQGGCLEVLLLWPP
jgi:hypothetical protein